MPATTSVVASSPVTEPLEQAVTAGSNWIEISAEDASQLSLKIDAQGWQTIDTGSEPLRFEFKEILELQLPKTEGFKINFNGKPLTSENENILSKKLTFRKDATQVEE